MSVIGILTSVKSLLVVNTVAQAALATVAVYEHMPVVKQAVGTVGNAAKGTGKLIGKGIVAAGKATIRATKTTYSKLSEKIEEKYDDLKYYLA